MHVYIEKCQWRRGTTFEASKRETKNTDEMKIILKNLKKKCPQYCPAAPCTLLMTFICWEHAYFSSLRVLGVA